MTTTTTTAARAPARDESAGLRFQIQFVTHLHALSTHNKFRAMAFCDLSLRAVTALRTLSFRRLAALIEESGELWRPRYTTAREWRDLRDYARTGERGFITRAIQSGDTRELGHVMDQRKR